MSEDEIQCTSDSPAEVDMSDSERDESLIELLEFEIKRIRAEESRPGWTRWALLGGLASAFWFLTLELERGAISWQNSLFFFLVLSIGYQSTLCIRPLLHLFSAKSAPRARTLSQQFPRAFYVMLYESAWDVVLLVIVSRLDPAVGLQYEVSLFVFYILNILTALLASLVYPLFKYANMTTIAFSLGSKRARASGRVTSILLLALGMFSVFGLISTLLDNVVVLAPAEYRVGGLLFASAYILRIIVRGQPESPLLDTLIELRRALGLGKIDFESAARQAEIALTGLSASEILQDDLGALLRDLEQINVCLETARKELLRASLLEDYRDRVEDQDILRQALIRSAESHVDEAVELAENHSSKVDQFRWRITLLREISPESEEEVDKLLAELDAAEAQFVSTAGLLREQLQAYKCAEPIEQPEEETASSIAAVEDVLRKDVTDAKSY